jgi:GntR family transcriptional regulator
VTIDRSGDRRPFYRQLAAILREQILGGTLQPGDVLPPESALIDEHHVSRNTVRQAVALLRAEGLVVTKHALGTFVRERPEVHRWTRIWYDREASPGSPTARTVIAQGGVPSWDHHSRREQADTATAKRLQIDVGDQVMVTDYVYRSNDEPIQFARSWEPLALTEGTDVELPEDGAAVGVVARFDHIGVRIDTVDEVVSARMPTDDEQRTLGMPAGVPIMVIERTYRAGDQAVETANIVVPGDRYVLHYGIPVR